MISKVSKMNVNYMKKKKFNVMTILLLSASFFFLISYVYAATWTADSQGAFDEGVYENTVFATDSVRLKEWTDTEKELPHDGTTDHWGIDMTGNILLMHMNENSGAIVDYSGNTNNGIYNTTLYSQGGKLNTAIGFDGDNDSVTIGYDSSLDVAANLTISTWLKPTAYVNDGVILGKPHTSQANPYVTYALGYSGDGRNYGLALGSGSTQRGCYTDTNTVVLNEWTQFTATFNGTQINLYINGELNKTCSYAYFEINQNSADLILGDYPYFGNTYDYAGNIDELAIFNRTLTSQEIEDIYIRQVTGYGGNHPGAYVSNIFDTGGESKWDNISWMAEIPYGQELSDNQATETGDFLRGMDMIGNVGLWHMNDLIGVCSDSSGNGNDGVLLGGVTNGLVGKFNTALNFNGSDGYADIPNEPSLNPTNQITIATWIKWNINPALGQNWASILNKNADNQYRLQHNNSNTSFEFAIRTTPNGNRWVNSLTSPQEGRWYFVVGTYNGSVLRMYVNGILESTNNHGGSLVTSTSNLNIGRRTIGDRYFNGIIDETAIFNRVLSAQEIADMYSRGMLRLNPSIRSCDDASCSGESWIDFGINPISPQNLIVDDNQYFQYKFDFETDDTDITPQLHEVNIGFNSPPNQPTNTTPADSTNNVELDLNLVASVFIDPDSDIHTDTEWRVDDDNDFSSPVWTRTGGIGEISTSINNANGIFANELSGKTELDHGVTYFWQVRYKDNGSNNWSDWSMDTSFVTLGICATIQNAATYNPYPTCGAATCEQGYLLINGQCIPSGGGGYALPGSIGVGQSDHQIDMYQQKVLGQINNSGINILGYIGSSGIFIAMLSGDRDVSQHAFTVAHLDMINQEIILQIASEPQTIRLYIGEEKKIDLDQDNVFDILIKYNGLLVNRLDLTIKQLGFSSDTPPVPASIPEYCSFFIRDLSMGMIGEDVKELQKYLNNNGFELINTGYGSPSNETAYFGLLTRDSLSKFQQTNHLKSTGKLDIETRSYLGCTINELSTKEVVSGSYLFTRNLGTGMTGKDVQELQKYLNNNGFMLAESGPGSVGNETEIFGTLTMRSLIKFQQFNKISPAVGYFGSVTRDVINGRN